MEEVQDHTLNHSDNFYNYSNEALKQEPCCDNLSDDDSIKVEEHDLEEFIEETVKVEKDQKNSLEIDQLYSCYNCNFECSDKPTLIVHVETHIAEIQEKLFKCNVRDFTSAHEDAGERSFKCSVCDYTCAQKSTLKNHLLVHAGDTSFKCNVCDYTCAQKSNLKRHSLVHTGERPFKFSICNYTCSQKSTLKTHLLVHTGEKPFICSICDYTCARKSNLKKHSLVHTGEWPFKCNVCGYTCADKGNKGNITNVRGKT